MVTLDFVENVPLQKAQIIINLLSSALQVRTTHTTLSDLPHAAAPQTRSSTSTSKTKDRKREAVKAPMSSNEIDTGRILRGEDTRTTVMLRNVPNKYSQEMMLACIDQSHRGLYDFFYLRIDFATKSNFGYCFINFIDPLFSLIVC